MRVSIHLSIVLVAASLSGQAEAQMRGRDSQGACIENCRRDGRRCPPCIPTLTNDTDIFGKSVAVMQKDNRDALASLENYASANPTFRSSPEYAQDRAIIRQNERVAGDLMELHRTLGAESTRFGIRNGVQF